MACMGSVHLPDASAASNGNGELLQGPALTEIDAAEKVRIMMHSRCSTLLWVACKYGFAVVADADHACKESMARN